MFLRLVPLERGLVQRLIVAGGAAEELLAQAVVDLSDVALVGRAVAGLVSAAGALVQLQPLVDGLLNGPVVVQKNLSHGALQELLNLDSNRILRIC